VLWATIRAPLWRTEISSIQSCERYRSVTFPSHISSYPSCSSRVTRSATGDNPVNRSHPRMNNSCRVFQESRTRHRALMLRSGARVHRLQFRIFQEIWWFPDDKAPLFCVSSVQAYLHEPAWTKRQSANRFRRAERIYSIKSSPHLRRDPTNDSAERGVFPKTRIAGEGWGPRPHPRTDTIRAPDGASAL
jgi:hypothetical protein